MSLVWAILAVVLATGVAITALLLVRRRAPAGGFFNDGDRAAGVFGVLATGFSVLIGFVVFLAFTNYDESRSGAETEALVVLQQVETAQLLPAAAGAELTGQLVCYGRSVVHQEWPLLQSGAPPDQINPWGVELFRTLEGVEPATAAEEAAYSKWLDQTSTREEARRDRLHVAEGITPSSLWIVLFLAAAVIFVFMLFFADSSERRVVQAVLIGSVVAVVSAMLVLLQFLDNPYEAGLGSLEPAAMERTLLVIDDAIRAVGVEVTLPCSATGEPVAA